MIFLKKNLNYVFHFYMFLLSFLLCLYVQSDTYIHASPGSSNTIPSLNPNDVTKDTNNPDSEEQDDNQDGDQRDVQRILEERRKKPPKKELKKAPPQNIEPTVQQTHTGDTALDGNKNHNSQTSLTFSEQQEDKIDPEKESIITSLLNLSLEDDDYSNFVYLIFSKLEESKVLNYILGTDEIDLDYIASISESDMNIILSLSDKEFEESLQQISYQETKALSVKEEKNLKQFIQDSYYHLALLDLTFKPSNKAFTEFYQELATHANGKAKKENANANAILIQAQKFVELIKGMNFNDEEMKTYAANFLKDDPNGDPKEMIAYNNKEDTYASDLTFLEENLTSCFYFSNENLKDGFLFENISDLCMLRLFKWNFKDFNFFINDIK